MEFDISPKSHFRGEIDEYLDLELQVEEEPEESEEDEADVQDAEAEALGADEDWSAFWALVFSVMLCMLWPLYALLLHLLLSPLDVYDWAVDLDNEVWGLLGFEQGVLL